MEIKVYTPRREESFLKLSKEIFLGFKEGRDLAWSLFMRDLKAGNRKSVLGFVWLFLPPFATAGVWIFLNSQRVISIQTTPMAYTAFTLCGTLLWSLFAEAIMKPITRFQGAMGMMGKLNFPREAIVLASVYDAAFGLLVRLVLLIPVLWFMGYPPNLFFLPALLSAFGIAICGLAIGIFCSPIALLYADIGKGLPIILPFAMYLTPVIYPLRTNGYIAILQRVNPVTPFLERARSLFGSYDFAMNDELMIWSFLIFLMTIAGLLALKIALPIIVERSGS